LAAATAADRVKSRVSPFYFTAPANGADGTSPVAVSLDVVAGQLVVVFGEDVVAGATGRVLLYDCGPSQDCSAAVWQLATTTTFSDNTMTVAMLGSDGVTAMPLEQGRRYKLALEADAVKDAANNAVAATNMEIYVGEGMAAGPVLDTDASLPQTRAAGTLNPKENIVLRFNEEVQAGTGVIEIRTAGCTDTAGWADTNGNGCAAYEAYNLCTAAGDDGPGLARIGSSDTVADLANNGDGAASCCVCQGAISAGAGALWGFVDVKDAFIQGKTVVVDVSGMQPYNGAAASVTLPAGGYFAVVGAGALLDAATGTRASAKTNTDSFAIIQVAAENADALAPTIVAHDPVINLASPSLKIMWSEAIAVGTSACIITLQDCGVDNVCWNADDTDIPVATADLTVGTGETRASPYGLLTISSTALTDAVVADRKYELRLCSGIIVDTNSNTNGAGIALNFFTGSAGVDSGSYLVREMKKCVAETGSVAAGHLMVHELSAKAAADLCYPKCSMGCVGPNCHCSGFDGMAGAMDAVLCLPAHLCKEACDGHEMCSGFSMHKDMSQCMLSHRDRCNLGSAQYTTQLHTSWNHYERRSGRACAEPRDFGVSVGDLFVSPRVHQGVDFVLHPEQSGSLEVTAATGQRLTDDGLSTQRLMVVPCGEAAATVTATPAAATATALVAAMQAAAGYDQLPFALSIDGAAVLVTFKTPGARAAVTLSTAADVTVGAVTAPALTTATFRVPGSATVAEVQALAPAALALVAYTLNTAGSVTATPATATGAALATALQAAPVYASLPFTVAAEGSNIVATFKTEGARLMATLTTAAGVTTASVRTRGSATVNEVQLLAPAAVTAVAHTMAPGVGCSQAGPTSPTILVPCGETVGSVTATPATATASALATAVAAAPGYGRMPFTVSVDGTDVLVTFKAPGAQLLATLSTETAVITAAVHTQGTATVAEVQKFVAATVQQVAHTLSPGVDCSGGGSSHRMMIIPCAGTCGVHRPSKEVTRCGTAAGSVTATPAAATAAGLVTAMGAAPGYSLLPFTVTVDGTAVLVTFKTPGARLPATLSTTAGVTTATVRVPGTATVAEVQALAPAAITLVAHTVSPGVDCSDVTTWRDFKPRNTVTDAAHVDTQNPGTALAAVAEAVVDTGYSSSSVLRFAPVAVNGGKYKVCLCDSLLEGSLVSGAGVACSSQANYNIEIGTLHVSGLSCLLRDSKLRKGECVSMYSGGLRCYRTGEVVTIAPMASTVPPLPRVEF